MFAPTGCPEIPFVHTPITNPFQDPYDGAFLWKKAEEALINDAELKLKDSVSEQAMLELDSMFSERLVQEDIRIGKEERKHLKELKAKYYRRLGRKCCKKDLKEEFEKNKADTIYKIQLADAESKKYGWTKYEDGELLKLYTKVGLNYEHMAKVLKKNPVSCQARLFRLRRNYIEERE